MIHQKHCNRFELVGTSHFELLKIVKEEYCTITGDDDFLIINTLINSKKFLQNNLDFNSCHGHSRIMYFNKKLNNAIFGEYIYPHEYLDNSPTKRFNHLKTKYTVLQFSLNRTKNLKKIYSNCKKIIHPNLLEIAIVASIVINGKSKKLNQLYIIRGVLHKLKIEIDYFEEFLDYNWQIALKESYKAILRVFYKFDFINKSKDNYSSIIKDFLLYYYKNILIKDDNLKSKKIKYSFLYRIYKSVERRINTIRFLNSKKYENLILMAIRSKK